MRMLLLRSALLLVLPFTSAAAPADPFAARLDERMPELLAHYGVPGAVVSSINEGTVSWTKAYGLANLAAQTPMRPDMVFEFGSLGKAVTAWGVMRLVEQERLELDAPANRYLKRWRIPSAQYDANEVTIRRLLSHTGGLSVQGYSDYSPGRRLPTLVEVLQGKNQLDGPVVVMERPGTNERYSGGGFAVLQMVLEDVTGESFATFIQREVTEPLGVSSLRWDWTPELEAAAPTPYTSQNRPLAYRHLAVQSVGSEMGRVSDFARFVAAAVEGPAGEPPGRGVLKPETLVKMREPQPGTPGDVGLSYGLMVEKGHVILAHSGGNPGWSAYFVLDTSTRQGFMIAANSMRGLEMAVAISYLWKETALGLGGGEAPPPETALERNDATLLGLAGVLGLCLLVSLGRYAFKKRRPPRPLVWRLLAVMVWSLVALVFWLWLYVPFPGILPVRVPDVLPSPQVDLLMAVLVAWVVFSGVKALRPISAEG